MESMGSIVFYNDISKGIHKWLGFGALFNPCIGQFIINMVINADRAFESWVIDCTMDTQLGAVNWTSRIKDCASREGITVHGFGSVQSLLRHTCSMWLSRWHSSQFWPMPYIHFYVYGQEHFFHWFSSHSISIVQTLDCLWMLAYQTCSYDMCC